jgi:hypothetical protein
MMSLKHTGAPVMLRLIRNSSLFEQRDNNTKQLEQLYGIISFLYYDTPSTSFSYVRSMEARGG